MDELLDEYIVRRKKELQGGSRPDDITDIKKKLVSKIENLYKDHKGGRLLKGVKRKRNLSDYQKKRLKLVKFLMKKNGLGLGEASKYIKQHEAEFNEFLK